MFSCQCGINVCLQVVPTVTVLAMMKARLTGAVKGHALLKKKADALTLRCACVHLCCLSPRAHRVLLPNILSQRGAYLRRRGSGFCFALSGSIVFVKERPPATATSAPRPCRRPGAAGRARRFRQILKKIVETKQEMGRTMRAGAFALTEAKYAAGEFGTTVLDSVESVRGPLPLDHCKGAFCVGTIGTSKLWRVKHHTLPAKRRHGQSSQMHCRYI